MEEILNGLKSAIENLDKAIESGLDKESTDKLLEIRKNLIYMYLDFKTNK